MTPSEFIKEVDRLKRLVRRRPAMTVSALLVMAALGGAAIWLRSAPRDSWPGRAVPTPVIRAPVPGALVDEVETIGGTGAVPSQFQYPLVTPVQAGVPYIAGPSVTVHVDGSWEGSARFGDASTSAGTRFQLQILRSEEPLPEGAFARRPGNSTLSRGVNVERR